MSVSVQQLSTVWANMHAGKLRRRWRKHYVTMSTEWCSYNRNREILACGVRNARYVNISCVVSHECCQRLYNAYIGFSLIKNLDNHMYMMPLMLSRKLDNNVFPLGRCCEMSWNVSQRQHGSYDTLYSLNITEAITGQMGCMECLSNLLGNGRTKTATTDRNFTGYLI